MLRPDPLFAKDIPLVHLTSAASRESIRLSEAFQVLYDQDRNLTPEDILKPEHQAQFVDMNGQDVYQIRRGHFWLRSVFQNEDPTTENFRLVHHYSYTDQIYLYRQEGNQLLLVAQRGDSIPNTPDENDFRLPTFRMELPPGPNTFYILVDSRGPVNLEFSILSTDAFITFSRNDYLLLGVLFGFVIVMVGYNVFLAMRLRNPSYYLYVGYIACFGIVQLLFTGTAQYLLPDSQATTIFLNQGIVVFAELTAIFGSLFALSFLNIKKNSPLLYILILAFYPISLFDIVLPFIDYDRSVLFVLLSNSYISAALLIAGVQGCMRRYRPAYFYLIAWGFLIIGSMITMARIYGFLPNNSFTTWSQFFGGALEVILLSLAMGDKMSLIQEDSHTEISKLNNSLAMANNELQKHLQNVEAIVDDKTRDIKSMLANIQQGIFMISAKDGLIVPDYSHHLTDILNTQAIAGRSVRDVLLSRSDLSADLINQTETVIFSALGDTELNFEVNQELLVKELLFIHPRGQKLLELEWSPICSDAGDVEKILVTTRDVTILRQLERQQMVQQKELEAIGKVLKVSTEKFSNFLGTCQDFLKSCQDTILTEQNLSMKSINRVFMNVHTMKGMARTFHLEDLANAFHEFEGQLEPFRHQAQASLESKRLMPYLQSALDLIQFYRTINFEKLGRKQQKADQDQNGWMRSKVNKLRGLDTSRMKFEEREIILQVIDGLEQRYALNLEKSLESILQSLPVMADSLGKANPSIIFEHDEILLTGEGQLLVERTFVHLLSNSLDHGIEAIEERKALGKPRRGEIRLNTWVEGDELLISIKDDGQGLNLLKIYEKAKARKLCKDSSMSQQELAHLIFEAGFSTKDEATLTSGRGVGMDAVRTYLINSNSRIEILLLDTARQHNDLRPIPFLFVIHLDKKLFLNPKISSREAQVA